MILVASTIQISPWSVRGRLPSTRACCMLYAAGASMPIFLPSGRAARLQNSALKQSVDGLLQSADLQAAAQRFLSMDANKCEASSQAVVSVVQCELARVSLDDQVGFLCSDQATTCTIVAAWCQQSRLCSLAHLDTSSATPSAVNSLTKVHSLVHLWNLVQGWCLSSSKPLHAGHAQTKYPYCWRFF